MSSLSSKNIFNFVFLTNYLVLIAVAGVNNHGIGQKPRPSPKREQKPGGRLTLFVRLWNSILDARVKYSQLGISPMTLVRLQNVDYFGLATNP